MRLTDAGQLLACPRLLPVDGFKRNRIAVRSSLLDTSPWALGAMAPATLGGRSGRLGVSSLGHAPA